MPDSFGARLREQREARHIALTAIADRTKIKLSLLEALEADDVSHWPAGIFRRAYIRSYADAIGLRPDDVVREFNQRYPDPLEPVLTPAEAAAKAAAATAGTATRLRELMGAAFGSLSLGRLEIGRLRAVAAGDAPAAATPATPVAPLVNPPVPVSIDDGPPISSDVAAATVSAPTGGSAATEEADRTRGDEASDVPSHKVNDPRRHEASEATVDKTDNAQRIIAAELPSKDAPASTAASVDAPAIAGGAVGAATSVAWAPAVETDLSFMAELCTTLGRLEQAGDVAPFLEDVALLVDAVGLIVWQWDPNLAALRPVLGYGYSEAVLAHLPDVGLDSCNATAAAFRSGQICSVDGGDRASDGLVVPLIVAAGCAGVLAIELPSGSARQGSTRAVSTIVAAQLARLIAAAPPIASLRRHA